MFGFFLKSGKKDLPRLPDIKLIGTHILVRPPQLDDMQTWIAIRKQNQGYLKPFEPTWPKKALTEEFYFKRQIKLLREWKSDKKYAFVIVNQSGAIIGGVNINSVRRDKKLPSSASFGYWIAEQYQGKGYMTEALTLLIEFSVTHLKIGELNIACLPHNQRSIKLARRLGFQKTGYAKKYLQINGKRQDHILHSLCYKNLPDGA